jgi:hypothetical protein
LVARSVPYRDKKVVSVFVRFRAPRANQRQIHPAEPQPSAMHIAT